MMNGINVSALAKHKYAKLKTQFLLFYIFCSKRQTSKNEKSSLWQ